MTLTSLATRPAAASSSGPSSLVSQALVGTTLAGFQLESVLGGGGMGLVFAARRTEAATQTCPERVALKLLAPELSRDPEFVERFRREAEALTRLRHPNLIEVYGKGELPEGPTHYFVMEHFEGRDLRALLGQGPLEPAAVASIIRQAAAGLAYAHQHGIVHRDIKPANILITGDPLGGGVVKVVDFGVAQLAGPAHALTSLTRSQLVLGTINYMSPEQRTDASEIDLRTDVYALGVVAYELLTGRLPIGAFEPPSELIRGLPRAVDQAITQSLQRERSRRPSAITDFSQALDRALAPRRRTGLIGATIAAAAVGLVVIGLGARPILEAQRPKLDPKITEKGPDPVGFQAEAPAQAIQPNTPPPQKIPSFGPASQALAAELGRQADVALAQSRQGALQKAVATEPKVAPIGKTKPTPKSKNSKLKALD
ncbi:MAG: serine/threonine protein kinase [Deltaproteobacteria bacterium]|nr:serine/threonine protein kinase [Deltaproteobacteria bacterium]